jgi:glyoxylase-like metal-dependent hydrolase (beta-lactamase superfamily II)
MNRRISSVLGNSQRLDGGAMFGNAPRALWSRWLVPDEQHRVKLACRALLIEEEGRTILCETGIGLCFPPELRARYGVEESEHVLLESLAALGLEHTDIDVVVLSHLHFDHAGGLLAPWRPDAAPELLFPRATFVVGQRAWDRAVRPHTRDRASFLPHLPALLEATGRLELVEGALSPTLGPDYTLHASEGHTPGLILLEVPMPAGPVLFAGDLAPGVPWVHAPITMGYDRWPERLVDEKQALFTDLHARGGRLFFTHDPETAMGTLKLDERGHLGVYDPQPILVRVSR